MGDRVSAQVSIGGHLETIDEAEALIDALLEEDILDDADEGMAHLREAVEQRAILEYDEDEVNYGVFEHIDTTVQLISGLWCSTSFGSGHEFSEGIKTVMHVDGQSSILQISTAGGSPTIELQELEHAVHAARLSDDPLAAVDTLIANTKRAAGEGLPPLTASPAVSAWLKIFAEKAA